MKWTPASPTDLQTVSLEQIAEKEDSMVGDKSGKNRHDSKEDSQFETNTTTIRLTP